MTEDHAPGLFTDAVRIAPLPPVEWSAAMPAALAAIRPANPRHPYPARGGGRSKGLNALGLLAWHPALTEAFHTFTGHILFGTTLTVRQRELLILRVAAVRGAKYEWTQHSVLALDNGIDEAEIARVAVGPAAPGWSRLERALVSSVDELLADAKVQDATWEVLAADFDEQQLLDLIFTVGAYDLLAMAFRSCGIPLDADLAGRPE